MKRRLLLIRSLAALLLSTLVVSSGYSQNALDFDGVDDHVVTTYNGLTGNATRTFEAWIKPNFKSSQMVIADMGATSTSARFTVNLIGGKLRIEVAGNGKTGSTVLSDGKWHHIAIVYDNSLASNKFSMYVDGVLELAPFDLTVPVNTGTGSFRIGVRIDATNFYEGQIDEVRLWNTARTLTELITDSTTEFCTSQIGLVAYHRFNSGIAGGNNANDTISTDDSGLNNDGELHGFALSGNTSNWVSGKLSPCTPPSCLNPTGLGATNVLGNSADIYWTQNNSGSTFKVEYGTSGFTLGSGTKLTPTNDTISLSSLTAQTTYDVYVKEICSATDSSVWAMFSFATGCALINTFPYFESFDSTSIWVSGVGSTNSGSAIDPCWTASPVAPPVGTYIFFWGTRNGNTGSSGTGPLTDYSGNGNYILSESSYGSNGDTASLRTPNFDLSSLTSPQLSFQYHMYGSTMGDLFVMAWNGSGYDLVTTLNGNQGNSWREAIVDLSNYKSNPTHFVFRSVKGSTLSDIAIDEIKVEEAPACPKVTLVTLDSVTSSSVQVSFSSSGSSFNVEYGPTGFSQGTGTTTTLTASGQTITGLGSNMISDFYIQNDCSGSSNGSSVWSGPYTARTLCAYTNFYFTNWDQLGNAQQDFCWTLVTEGPSSAYAQAYDPPSNVLQPFSGNIYYRVYNGAQTESYFVSPEISDLDLNNLQLRVQVSDIYTGSTGVTAFYVGTMGSINDTASLVIVDTIETTTNAWTQYVVPFSNVPSGHKHVVLQHSNNANFVALGIDDLYIEQQPACAAPSAGVISEVKDTSVVIDWLAGDGTQWEIEYGTTGFTLGSGMSITGILDTHTTVTGLSAQTCYEFYIRDNCTSNNSPWYGPISACTKCATITAPFFENFDGSTWVTGSSNNAIDPCWDRTPSITGNYRWESNSGSTTSGLTGPISDASGNGKYIYTEASSGSTGDSAVLTLPHVDFSNLTAPTLSFAYHMYGTDMGDLYVLIADGNQIDTLQVISGPQQTGISDAWKVSYLDLSAHTSGERTIHFVGIKGGGYTSDMAIDSVAIDEAPTCVTPTNFILDTTAVTFADFSWSSASNGASFKMEYGPTGFTQGSGTHSIAYANSSPTTVPSLTPNTTYDIYLADMCDSTNWIGPITFTTLLADDAELQSVISPSQLVCGDSSYTVEVNVKNNGLNAISSLTVGANISGAFTANVSNTYNGTIAPGASATVSLGTINSYAGGFITIEAYTGLSGDQDVSNDTLTTNTIEIISGQPVVYPVDTICATDTIGEFAAIAQTGIIHNWYKNANDATPFVTGDTVNAQPNQTLFLDRSKEVDLLVNDGPSSSQFGNMFKIYIKSDFTFTGFSFEPATSGAAEPIAFYKQGTFVGHETTRGDWTPIDSLAMPMVIFDNWYRFNFTNPVQFTAGDTISIYIANKLGTKIRWSALSSVSSIGDLFISNHDFEYYAGVTGAYFGNNMATGTAPRAVSSILHYTSNNLCGNNRIAVTMPVNNDTAVASFAHTVTNGGDVDFDASASKGHVFDWNFGDGNNGNGENTKHTYLASGSYTITLTVTDTICGTTDTISQTVISTIGLSEFALDGRVAVYPNPNNGKFNVELNLNEAGDTELVVINSVGQIVHRRYLGQIDTHTETELDINNLTPGVYQLHVMTNGKSTTVKITVL